MCSAAGPAQGRRYLPAPAAPRRVPLGQRRPIGRAMRSAPCVKRRTNLQRHACADALEVCRVGSGAASRSRRTAPCGRRGRRAGHAAACALAPHLNWVSILPLHAEAPVDQLRTRCAPIRAPSVTQPERLGLSHPNECALSSSVGRSGIQLLPTLPHTLMDNSENGARRARGQCH